MNDSQQGLIKQLKMRSVLHLKSIISVDDYHLLEANNITKDDYISKYVKAEQENPTVQFKKMVEKQWRILGVILCFVNLIYSISAIVNPLEGSN